MNAKLTDDAVAGLPLSLGRAELLEEIMSTPVLDDRPIRSREPRRRTRWLVPAAAAVVVAALALGTARWAGDDPAPAADRSAPVMSMPAVANGYVVLDAPGWTMVARHADEGRGEMSYENGDQYLELMWGLPEDYDGYVEDRRHIVRPAADGAPIQILGLGAQMWAYSPDDHTAIREVDAGQWIEFRGEGMDEAGYLALLGQLRAVDEAEFDAMLPEEFVTGAERNDTVDTILDEIDAASDGPLLPEGVDRASITSDQVDDYQLGSEISGQVACAWLGEYAAAEEAGDQGRMDAAAAALNSSHDWPVLHRMDDRGYFPEVLWMYAQQVADAGTLPEDYQNGLGC
ncbi:hypothetical protein [Nocardioides sp. SR21]|uniref:hypothetical protein n=1 Tax=Nocardioides sp. SR21 TaxID=2919501 RepID=UPI001FAA96DE|nr:hypothetical protein [Nocardioides sp. SR21]